MSVFLLANRCLVGWLLLLLLLKHREEMKRNKRKGLKRKRDARIKPEKEYQKYVG